MMGCAAASGGLEGVAVVTLSDQALLFPATVGANKRRPVGRFTPAAAKSPVQSTFSQAEFYCHSSWWLTLNVKKKNRLSAAPIAARQLS